jgi:hypothetical protein
MVSLTRKGFNVVTLHKTTYLLYIERELGLHLVPK